MKTRFFFKTLALFFLLGLFSCTTEQDMIDNPQVGDVYQMECHNVGGHQLAYKLVKVKAIDGQHVILMSNQTYYNEKVYCLVEGDYFSLQDAYLTSKAKIKEIYRTDSIVEVFRVYEASCLGNNK
ncbi:MAG: hypothetical protein P4L28_06495 [Paludibacteraceae bacterium]|nr:hypothetical protein [Paludibacteraceae bacterium]